MHACLQSRINSFKKRRRDRIKTIEMMVCVPAKATFIPSKKMFVSTRYANLARKQCDSICSPSSIQMIKIVSLATLFAPDKA